MKQHLATIKSSLRHLLPTARCRYCRERSNAGLCPDCEVRLGALQPQRCQRCGLPRASQETGACGSCLRDPPPYARLVTAFDYGPPIDSWVNNFKHRRDLRDGHLLAAQLTRTIKETYISSKLPDALVPVPLHWRRQLWRSFNQADWICDRLGRNLRLPAIHPLRRIHGGHTQQGLQRRQRQHNLKQVYRLPECCQHLVRNRHLALVDDVVTTGATVSALTTLLTRAGAARVDVWCLARTPLGVD